jgi:hypothetical protein
MMTTDAKVPDKMADERLFLKGCNPASEMKYLNSQTVLKVALAIVAVAVLFFALQRSR